MELQHMITSIVEDTIEANFFDGVDTNYVNVPHETYEDTLAIAIINSILVKYKDDLEDTDSNNKVSKDHNSDQRRSSDKEKFGKPPSFKSSDTNTTSSKKEDKSNSFHFLSKSCDLLSLSDSSYTSASSFSSSPVSSLSPSSQISSLSSYPSSITSSSSESLISSMSITPPPSENILDEKSYDPVLGLYLSKNETGKIVNNEENWTLRQSSSFFNKNQISLSLWHQRLNIKQSLFHHLQNLTDDVKKELESRNFNVLTDNVDNFDDGDAGHCSFETNNNCTEESFYNSSLFWHSHSFQQILFDKERFYLKLGEDIGETNTDDITSDNDNDDLGFVSVLDSIQKFESFHFGQFKSGLNLVIK